MNPTNAANPNPPFFGQRVSIPGVNINQATPNQVMYENDYSKQTFFGTSGDVALGIYTSKATGNSTMGMQVVDANGNVVFEMDGQTWYWFDTSGNAVMIVGYLPVSKVYGWAVSTPGNTLIGVV